MYLSKLELHGFKSFADPTSLHFDPGVTAIVGPNGCGKSNIVDAVRWVIGEQRARILRSEKMENVIFNGTSKRRPLGLSEVLLTIENTRGVLPTEYSEVTVGRRLYRSGDSEYLLNGVPCRLKDIVDLFMDTGMGAGAYSVIELKMIEEILSDNAHDRRRLFEEAAGITKYKQRRRQALSKLGTTQADLDRLRDLTEEIDKRVASLKRQAAKAERFKTYEAQLHTLELALAQTEYDRLTAQQVQIQGEIQGLEEELEAYQAGLAKEEAHLEALRTTRVGREQTLSGCQQRLNAHLETTRQLEADLRLEQERLETARRDYERTTKAQEEAEARREELEAHAEGLAHALVEAEPARIHTEEAQRVAQADRDRTRAAAEKLRTEVQHVRNREAAAAEAEATARRRLDRLAARIELLKQERERLQAEANALQEKLDTQETAQQAAEVHFADAKANLENAQSDLAEAETLHATRQQTLEAATQTWQQAERNRAAIAAEAQVLESLVLSYEAFSNAVQFLADDASWTDAPLRTIADVLTCADTDRRALDAALGELASCIVVETDAEVQQALARLREEEQGQATFLVLERLQGQSVTPPTSMFSNGVPLLSVVGVTEPRYAPLVPVLLFDTYLVDTLEEAQVAAAGSRARFVTRDGEWAAAGGLAHGGSVHTDGSALSDRLGRRAQYEAAQQQHAALDTQVMEAEAAVQAARVALANVPVEAHRAAVQTAQQAFANARSAYDQAVFAVDAQRNREQDLAARQDTIHEELAESRHEIETLQEVVTQAEEERASLLDEREQAEETYRVAEASAQAAQERLAEANVAAVQARNHADNLQRDRDRTQREIGALVQRAEDQQQHLEGLNVTIDAAQQQRDAINTQLEDVRSGRAALDDAVTEAQKALLEVKVAIDQVEHGLRTLRQEREQRMRDENLRAVKQAEVQTRLEDLIASIAEDFNHVLTDQRVVMPEEFEEAVARDEVKDLRAKIRNMGSINALALEEYAEEKERLDFLLEQQADLEQAESTLLETIDEINTTAAARFGATYQAIERNFHELFTELFGGDATGHLQLTDPTDPLESPIEIMAKPRGKRPVVISQLSSGEKTLTAIALLFAIYLVKPSPFCILDEVDAPLDEANIDRFMHLIRRFADETQFILVTHNKRTMELADRLYGITMQEQGVSRLVGVRFDEALEVVGE